MPFVTNNAEGQPAGTALTLANSGDINGDPFTNLNGSVLYADNPVSGIPGSARVLRDNSASAYPSWGAGVFGSTIGSGKIMSARGYFYCDSIPTTSGVLICCDRSNNTNAGCRIAVLASTGRFIVQGTAGTVFNVSSSIVWPRSQWVRLEISSTGRGDSQSGDIRAAAYLGESTTPLFLYEQFGNANTGTGGHNVARFGRFSGAWGSPLYFDDMAARDGSLDFIGPAASRQAKAYAGGQFMPFFG